MVNTGALVLLFGDIVASTDLMDEVDVDVQRGSFVFECQGLKGYTLSTLERRKKDKFVEIRLPPAAPASVDDVCADCSGAYKVILRYMYA
jgi:hypothetical protein